MDRGAKAASRTPPVKVRGRPERRIKTALERNPVGIHTTPDVATAWLERRRIWGSVRVGGGGTRDLGESGTESDLEMTVSLSVTIVIPLSLIPTAASSRNRTTFNGCRFTSTFETIKMAVRGPELKPGHRVDCTSCFRSLLKVI